jgi:putative FmdB family regulatory protein
MPIYVYQCADCEAQTEKRQGFADAPLTTCETCSGSLRRVLQPVGIIFKGSGWYSTDNRSSSAKKDSANGEAKTDSTSESAASSTAESKNGSADKSADKSAAASTTSTTSGTSGTSGSSTPAAASTAAS